MIRNCFLILIILITSYPDKCFCQGNSSKHTFLPNHVKDPSKAAVVKQIQSKVQNIYIQKITDSSKLENEQFLDHMPDGGGELTGYFKNGNLVKLKVWIGISYRVAEDTYYYSDNKLIYVLKTTDNFHIDNSGKFDYGKFEHHFQEDIYFDNGKLIDVVASDKEGLDNNADASQELQNAAEYKKMILKKHRKKK